MIFIDIISSLPLSKRIKVLRTAKGYSQKTLANEIGVQEGAIYGWESGKHKPNYDSLKKLADAFQIGLEALIPKDKGGQT